MHRHNPEAPQACRAFVAADAVVMLTWSDWFTEPRANRYHFAVRFARHLPVIFVQPDLDEDEYRFDATGHSGISVLHVPRIEGAIQSRMLAQALVERRVLRPLLWIYNSNLVDFIASCHSTLKVYHATEDYLDPHFWRRWSAPMRQNLDRTLKQVDLLVAVSEGVRQSYCNRGGYGGRAIVLPNGCDYSFWGIATEMQSAPDQKVAIYQGGINRRLDLDLLTTLAEEMPDWTFEFCGAHQPGFHEWERVTSIANVRDLGFLSPEEVRARCLDATVGLIPFVSTPLIENSLPLKAYEYVACGLPVVSVPIHALGQEGGVITFARTAAEFAAAIRSVAPSRHDPAAVAMRRAAASCQDYDSRFRTLMAVLHELEPSRAGAHLPLNILILYHPGSTHVNTIAEHLQSFSLFSRHRIFYLPATHGSPCRADIGLFDAIIVHYSIRLSIHNHLAPSFAKALRNTCAFKALFIQDEYDGTETARSWIESLGIHTVFTCVPARYVDVVYPRARFPRVEFLPTLTGYAPLFLPQTPLQLMSDRKLLIGYRGRTLPAWYGRLGWEKAEIAVRMKAACRERGVAEDIEWQDSKRIYGDAWCRFLAGCKATLGTESGANVFDQNGTIRACVERMLQASPRSGFEELYRHCVAEHEGMVKMNQISPKLFEAIAMRTALVLFEGEYSGILQPERHYIPLRKDFGNLDEVFAKLSNDAYLEALAERAYRDVIASGRYGYPSFVAEFDACLKDRLPRPKNNLVVSVVHRIEPTNSQRPGSAIFTAISSALPTNLPLVTAPVGGVGFVWRRQGLVVWIRMVMRDWRRRLWRQLPYRYRHSAWSVYNRMCGRADP